MPVPLLADADQEPIHRDTPPLPDRADCPVPGVTTARGPPEHVTLRRLLSQSATTTETPSAENNGQAEALEN